MFIKKLFLGIIAFPLLAIQAQGWEEFYQFKSSKLFENLCRIEEDVLINYQGIKYPKIAFKDDLHENLAYIMKDPEQADIIHEAYSRHILPSLSEEVHASFSNALLKTSVLFESDRFTPEKALLVALKEEKPSIMDWVDQHQESFQTFITEANRPARPNLAQRKDPTAPYKIAIMTTTASGGNYSVTGALKKFFLSLPNIEVVIIDSETIAEESDPIMLATGAVTYDGIYAKYSQQNNDGMDPVLMRDVFTKNLGKYIPSRFGLNLKEKMREVKPDYIISTRSYNIDDICLCTLGVPFRMLHCDYELSFFVLDLYGKVQPEMMKFWLPSLDAPVFRTLFEKYNRLDLYNEQDSSDAIMEKIAQMTHQSIDVIQDQFELFGYPLCSEFQKVEDKNQLTDLRKKWNIQPEEIPILLSMGKNGVGVLDDIFDQLSASEDSLPFKYFFVCGKNADLKQKLEQKANGNKRFSIQGLISLQEMNELMNLCPVTISKPGGSFATEAVATGTYLLIMCSHPWEEANGDKIEKLGLGQRLQEDHSLSFQITESLEKASRMEKFHHNNESRKNLLIDDLEKRL